MSLSIGRTDGIEYDPTSDRWKGLIPVVTQNAAEIQRHLGQCIREAAEGGTRLTVRIFTNFQDLNILQGVSLPWRDGIVRCEAFIPVNNGGVAYFGGNTTARANDERVVAEEGNLLTKATATPPKKRELPPGFKVEILHHVTRLDVADLAEMYAASYTSYITEFTPAVIQRMVFDNAAAVVRNPDGRIVAISQGETAEIPEVGVKLVELSDTATHPAYRSLGLTTLCKLELLRCLTAPDTVIFAESRAVSMGVLRQNHSIGMRVGGRLERHCKISSDQQDVLQEGAYGNMVVFYHPGT